MNVKLNLSQVKEIKEHLKNGRSCRSLSFQYGVSMTCITGIRDGKTWVTDVERVPKLTAEDVYNIRKRIAEGPRGTASRICEEYGLASSTVDAIKFNRVWKDVKYDG